ncbi:alpha/beta fold hydrolase [Mycoplasmatota bacterium]|nr:alpha/beta fold hydrolase [Mycoplasmatota bacterium]
MKICGIGSTKLAYKLYANSDNKNTIVIDTCLGSCSAEWWHIAQKLSNDYRVLVYDRAGYGKSSKSKLKRTPKNIALELNKLIEHLNINSNIILIGHSQGGINLIQYALDYKEKIKALVLLDPATPFDDEFKLKLSKEEYCSSGVDKTSSHKLGLVLTSLGLGFLFKPLLKKSPPFYYHNYSKEASQYLLKSLTKRKTYQTALKEYFFTHHDNSTEEIVEAIKSSSLESIHVKLITHSSSFYIKELNQFAYLDEITATKVENVWQEIMKRYIGLSKNCEYIEASNSGHFIHLTDLDLVIKTIKSIES